MLFVAPLAYEVYKSFHPWIGFYIAHVAVIGEYIPVYHSIGLTINTMPSQYTIGKFCVVCEFSRASIYWSRIVNIVSIDHAISGGCIVCYVIG